MVDLEHLGQAAFEPYMAIGLFGLALLVACLGAIAGFITRKVLTLVVIVALTLGVIFYHQHIPMSPELHIDAERLKQTLF